MRKNLLALFFVLIFGAYPTLAYAEDSTTVTPTVATAMVSNETSTTVTPTVPVTGKLHTEDLKGKIRPTIHQELADAKQEMHTQITQARTAFKTKLAEIKDQTKKSIMEKLDSNINNRNKKRTNEMTERLTRLNSILSKISSKEAALKTAGKNTATLDTDIAAATTALATAQTAVTAQAAKDYVASITTDTALKGAASAAILQYKTDILAVFQQVVAAQQAVVKAYKDIGLLMGVTPSPTAIPTVTTVVTPTP